MAVIQLAPHRTDVNPSQSRTARVAILMSTHNGAQFLREQLDSLIRQSHQNWTIHVSDDDSRDATLAILQEYQQRLSPERLLIRRGPCRGFAVNFLSQALNDDIQADYFAYCDQDDVWHVDKLARALDWLQQQPDEAAALYCSRTRLVDAQGRPCGMSPLFSRPPTFRNALVQSLAGGNTMIFNGAARRLLQQAGNIPIVSHDWWMYMLTSGSGGRIHYDPIPSIDYRQHGANLIGSNSSLSDRVFRVRRMLSGHFQQWNETNLKALRQQPALLTPANRKVLERFAHARKASLLQRLPALTRSGVHRQTLLGNLGLLAAALLRKV